MTICYKSAYHITKYRSKKTTRFMIKQIAYSVLVILILSACGSEEPTITKERPHEPWVFRSVLDQNARIVTLAIDDNLWAAYRTEDCALYKVWQGGVNFDGPVYTTHHGPQPTSIGDAFVENSISSPWSISTADGEKQKIQAVYKGHRYVGDGAQLMYELLGGIMIYEQVDASETEAMQPVFERTFTTEGVPAGSTVYVDFNTSSIVDEVNIKSNGELSHRNKTEVKKGKVTAINVESTLALVSNGETTLNTTFLPNPTITNPLNMGLLAEGEDNSGLPPGAKLIAQNDCKTCHNKNVKTVGPAYVSVANKYLRTPENIAMLTKKVINGGTGIWGNQIMNAHPDLPLEDVTAMIEYIMSLDGDVDRGEDSGSEEKAALSPDTSIDKEKLIPGALTRVYSTGKVKNLPSLSSYGKPKHAGVMGNFDNIYGDDFKGLTDDFSIVATGVLLIENEGTYGLRLWSDDGSRLSIGDRVVIDHDGHHGTSKKEATVELVAGAYPFTLEYFQAGGGKFLSFNWKGPGDDEWTIVPPEAIYHNSSLKLSESGLILPMANIANIPGDLSSLEAVHPSFDLYQARPTDFQPKVGGIDFMSDGDMIVSTWDAAGSVYRVKNHTSTDPSDITYKLIAQGLAEPLGVKVVDDRIYVMQKQELTELVDTDGDEIINEYRTLTDDWGVSANFHEFGFGLAEKDGYLYAALATAIEPGGASTNPQIADRGKVIKVDIKTGELEFIAHGFRTPNGVGVGYGGDIYIADNQGDWLPASKIARVKQGNWYGSRSVDPEGTAKLTETPPVVWLPQDEIGNSPSTPLTINVGPYKNQMIHSEVTHGGVKRVFVEEVDGVTQGSLFRFTQGIEAGVNRIQWGPDGSLYMGGIGAPGNWGHTGKLRYGLQRMQYNGKSTFEMLAVRAMSNGMEIEFTEPLEACAGWDPKGYTVTQWYYKPTMDYGGPKLGESVLPVSSANVSADRTKVFLEIPGLKEGHVVHIHIADKFVSELSHDLWTTETWYTLNKIPQGKTGKLGSRPCQSSDNTLSAAEKAAGWELLFDGKSMDKWRNYKKQTIGSSWIVSDGSIHLNAEKRDEGGWQVADGGDIITNDIYKDFEFHIEWKIGQCGNSGIMYNVKEADQYDYVWLTGPEMQILDNTCHPDTRFRTHRAGDLYDMIESKYNTVKPAGEWNKARIVSKNGKVQFWLNGYNVVNFEMHTDEWRDMVANSKFKDMPDFGTMTEGHISLQDHGDKVWFKNIKIRKL